MSRSLKMDQWRNIFPASRDSLDAMEIDNDETSASSSSHSSFERKASSLTNQLEGLLKHANLLFSVYSRRDSDRNGSSFNREKTALHQFELLYHQTDEESVKAFLQRLHSLSSHDFSVRVEWTGSSSSTNYDHCIFQVLDLLNELELLTEIRVYSLRSLAAARRIANYLNTNKRLASLRLGYYLGNWSGLVESAESLGDALAGNTSLARFQFLPFSTSANANGGAFQDHQEAEQAMALILQGVRRNANIHRLHLWAPGIIPSSLIRETIVDHATIIELFLDGETAPWYRGKGVDQYHEFQHLVWKMLCAPTCRLEKLKLHNFHLNTRTVDVFLSSLWKGHPLQVLDVSGNFLSSLSFPRFLEKNLLDESSDNRLRLLIVEAQCNSFASLEYDLTYHHDDTRCRQHCKDMMQLLQAKPGLSIQHPKIPAMLQCTTILPRELLVSSPPAEMLDEDTVSHSNTTLFTSSDQLQLILDHHRIVPPPIRKVDEDFRLALWPLILERCSTILTQGEESPPRGSHPSNNEGVAGGSTTIPPMDEDSSSSSSSSARILCQRQASVMYKIFQDWSFILLQGEQESSTLPFSSMMVT